MNKKLNKYVNEIIAIGRANDKEWDEGCNLFLSNVKAGQEIYPGVKLDWPAVAAEIGPFTQAEEADMLDTFKEDYNAHMSEVIALRREGKYDEARKVMENA